MPKYAAHRKKQSGTEVHNKWNNNLIGMVKAASSFESHPSEKVQSTHPYVIYQNKKYRGIIQRFI